MPPPPLVSSLEHDENSVRYVLYILFVRTRVNFGTKIFEADYVNLMTMKFNDILPFEPIQGRRGRGQTKKSAVSCPIHVSNSHNKLVELRPIVKEETA